MLQRCYVQAQDMTPLRVVSIMQVISVFLKKSFWLYVWKWEATNSNNFKFSNAQKVQKQIGGKSKTAVNFTNTLL